MKPKLFSYWLAGLLLSVVMLDARAFHAPDHEPLTVIDIRKYALNSTNYFSAAHETGVNRLKIPYADLLVGMDDTPHRPSFVSRRNGFLTGTNGSGPAISKHRLSSFAENDPHRVVKAFLDDNKDIFGHNSDALTNAIVKRDYVTAHNGLRTTIWEQQFDRLPVFGAILQTHVTKSGELVNISSHFANALTNAPGHNHPTLDADAALAFAAKSLGVSNAVKSVSHRTDAVRATEQRQFIKASGFSGESEAKLTWFPLNDSTLRLCWDLIVTPAGQNAMYQTLVDAETGEILFRRCLTENISAATYNVFTGESPTPMTPGWPTPNTNQPPLGSRTLVTLSALDTNASPNGWINDGNNTTVGNNVDAHLDRNADNIADPGSQPTGSPFRVFDFPVNFASHPTNSGPASVTELFYWCNWMHDKLYELGFTEAAGNFQTTNFNRGGLGGDALQADGMDGGGVNNSDMSTPPDGSVPRMQMYLWNGPTTNRDGDFDAAIVLHEYAHGLSWRLVGGGTGIGSLQTGGMGEGWSDFYAMSLLTSLTNDPRGVFPMGGYTSYLLRGLTQNYYFGIRRYPYSTDMMKNPLTLDDITQQFTHNGIPRSPIFTTTQQLNPAEVHNQGEVWCSILWEARANLMAKYGPTNGNQLILQLVTDAMKLGPAEPNYVEARDAILQADLVDNAGADKIELWHAFAKRGLGVNAWSPSSSQTAGLIASFDSDVLRITPAVPISFCGPEGGVFSPSCLTLGIFNTSTNTPSNWILTHVQPWLTLSVTNGLTDTNQTTVLTGCLNATANALAAGTYTDTLTLSNSTTGLTVTRTVTLDVLRGQPAVSFALDVDPGWTHGSQWAFGQPLGLGGGNGFADPTSGATGTNVYGVNLLGNYSTTVGGPYYLTSTALNFTGKTNVSLKFSRWLNCDSSTYVTATIDVSTNGTTWSSVWNYVGDSITDDTWTVQHYDLSAVADNKPTVYVRWGYRILRTGAYPYSGWNIDDVQFLASYPVVVAPPLLQISPTPSNAVLLSWSTNASGFALQQSTAVETTNWSDATESVGIVNTNYQATALTTNDLRVFRLKQP